MPRKIPEHGTISRYTSRKHKCRCAPCTKANNIYQRAYYAKSKKAQEANRTARLAKFGITVEEYDTLLEKQDGNCAICDKPCSSGRRLAVDHDHETGKIRGLLCGACNLGIGKLGDTAEALERALAYLRN